MISSSEVYQVECTQCGQVFVPPDNSPLWWKAKKRSEKGFLDALLVSGIECGCVEEKRQSNAPFRVFGYDGMCRDYDIPCHTFMEAIKTFRECDRAGDIVFIKGVSESVEHRLKY